MNWYFQRAVITMAALICGCGKSRTPVDWSIPDGYEGWIKIDYNVRATPALLAVAGHRIIRVPASGYVQTSSDLESGWAFDRVRYQNGEVLKASMAGEGGLVWGDVSEWEVVTGPMGTSHTTGRALNECFFVGSEAKFNVAGGCDLNDWPKVLDGARTSPPK